MARDGDMHPLVREGLGALARVGKRAVRAMVSSTLEDVGDLAEAVAKKTKKARSTIRDQDRRREEDE
jgi:hypothetical protein